MLDRVTRLRKDELVRGGFVLLVMFGIYNVLNYIFQMSMARALGPEDYGVFAALMSIIYIFAIPSEAIQNIIAKYTSTFNAQNESGKMKDLLIRSLRKGILFAALFFIAFLVGGFFISDFLSVSWGLVAVTGIFIFNIFTLPIVRGAIQGKKNFFSLGTNLVAESLAKVIFAVFFVIIGLGVYGALFGVIAGWIVSFLLSFLAIRTIINSPRAFAHLPRVYRTNLFVLLTMTAVVLMYSMDIIFARRFFSPAEAGEFAFVSLIGKAIFFASTAIAKAMLPISTEGFEKGNQTSKLFKKALFLVTILSTCALVAYFLFPSQIIWILSLGSSDYLGGAPLLFTVGLAYAFLSIANIIVIYKFSINSISTHVPALLCFPVVQVALFYGIGNSLQKFTVALALSCLAFLVYGLFMARKELLKES